MDIDTNQTSQEDVQVTNPQETVEEQVENQNAEEIIDYKTKFSESTREAQRLLEEIKARDAEIERLRIESESGASYSSSTDVNETTEELYPGFDSLDEEERKNLIEYTHSIEQRVKGEVYKDPAIAFARHAYNEKVWNDAFEATVSQLPALKDSREDFKSKYFNPDNVPTNIKDILGDLAKVYLFDKAQDLGYQQAIEQQERIDVERSNGGDKTPSPSLSLEDWSRMAASNPAEFARRASEYNDDLTSGRLK